MSAEAEPGEAGQSRNRASTTSVKKGSLYEILNIPKNASEDDIKRAYRKLALKYHPDKNLEGDPQKTERFKEINHANAVLSVPTRRKVYDEYGEMGLKLMEQFSDDDAVISLAFKPWFKWTFIFCGLSTCCCFFCCCGCIFCCNCCCNFCCGRYKPKGFEEDEDHVGTGENFEPNPTTTVIVDQPEESKLSSQHLNVNDNVRAKKDLLTDAVN